MAPILQSKYTLILFLVLTL